MNKKEIAVIHHNDLNKLNITKLHKREIDIFFSLISQLKDKNDNTITLYWDDIKELSDFSNKSNIEFQNILKQLSKKLGEIHYFIEDDSEAIFIMVFSKFRIDKENRLLEIKFNEEIMYMLNNLTTQFTSYDLKQLVSFQSRYTQHLYRYLKQYKATGLWRVSLEDFKLYMGAPDSYNFSKINEKIIKLSFNELSETFTNLKVKTIKGKGKESRKVVKLEFTFDKDYKSKTRVNYKDVIDEYIEIDGVKYKRVDAKPGKEKNPMLQKGIDMDYHKKMWDFIDN